MAWLGRQATPPCVFGLLQHPGQQTLANEDHEDGRTAKPDPSDPNTQAKPRAAVLMLHMINIDEFKKLSPFFTVKQYTRVIHH